MKVRSDFVTNSSSSSFVVSRDDISRDELKKILLEIANADNYRDEPYTEDDVFEDCVAYGYHIKEATTENPYTDWNDREYDNDYIIDNECSIRYNWDIIDEILSKHNIAYRYGYCS